MYNDPKYDIDLTGKIFTRLTAIRIESNDKKRRAYWLCRCSCGNTKIVRRDSLINKIVQSCGCLNADSIRKKVGPIRNVATRIVYNKYIDGAEQRGIDFNITAVDVENIIAKPCFYCGIPPSNTITRKRVGDTFNYNGIDRIDNTKGYTIDNCVPCCKRCNQAKNNMSLSEFISWADRLYNHSIKNKDAVTDIDLSEVEG